MSKFLCFFSLALAVLIVPLAGCGGTGVDLVPVSGTVTVEGKPVAGIHVTLLRLTGGGKQSFPFGQTDEEGKFTLEVPGVGNGAPVGEYAVLFEKLTMPDGSPIPAGQSPIDVGAVNQIPERYNDPSTSPESVTIPAGGTGSLSFDLKAK